MNEGTCRWISVEERLPTDGKQYFVLIGGQIPSSSAEYYCGDGWESDGKALHITHWLEVIPPPPPKKKVRIRKCIDAKRSGVLMGDHVRLMKPLPDDAESIQVCFDTFEEDDKPAFLKKITD